MGYSTHIRALGAGFAQVSRKENQGKSTFHELRMPPLGTSSAQSIHSTRSDRHFRERTREKPLIFAITLMRNRSESPDMGASTSPNGGSESTIPVLFH